nr:hypothetical protein [Solirubrobacterales bacterium]
LQTTTPAGVAAQITLTGSSIGTSPAASGPAGESAGRWADAEVRIEPPSAVDEPSWLTVTSWQGGGLVVDRLQPVAGEPGSYTTSEPIPVDGEWKTMLRLHQDDEMLGSPIYLPLDEAIPAPEVPALIGGEAVTRPVISDHQLLQREQKQGVASWLTTIAPLSVLGIALSLIALLAWGVRRVGRPLREHAPGHGGEAPGHEPEQAPARAEQPSRVATA